MAGILANSVSRTMLAAETAADKAVSGYITNEQITLTVSPTGTDYLWSQAKPAGSSARSDLSASTGASVVLTPDVEGYYLVTCIVDSTTTYVIRMAVVNISAVSTLGAMRLTPNEDAQIPTPPLGVTLYFSSDQSALCFKDSSGVVNVIEVV